MFVLTINQRDTLDAGDRVDTFLRALQDVPGLGDAVVLPFQRAVGDELIGAVESRAGLGRVESLPHRNKANLVALLVQGSTGMEPQESVSAGHHVARHAQPFSTRMPARASSLRTSGKVRRRSSTSVTDSSSTVLES